MDLGIASTVCFWDPNTVLDQDTPNYMLTVQELVFSNLLYEIGNYFQIHLIFPDLPQNIWEICAPREYINAMKYFF